MLQKKKEKTKEEFHEPVLLNEVLKNLEVSSGKKYIDATVGSAGHSLEIVRQGGKVLGIDQDNELLKLASARLSEICPDKDCFTLVQGNFRKIDELAKKEGFSQVDAILFDLGVSNIHLTDSTRGFSFSNPEALLDMRLDPQGQSVQACDLLNSLREDQLRSLFESTQDVGSALWLTRRVLSQREISPIKTVGDFLGVTKGLRSKPGLNLATLPMLALRMAVNTELPNLTEALPKAFDLLERGGKLAVISFHSGEDRIVKKFFKEMIESNLAQVKTKDIVVANEEEILINPRARSAKLRVIQKI